MNTHTTIKEDLTSIFNKFAKENSVASEIASRGFVFSEIESKKILFVGINPSYPEGSKPETFSYKPFEAVIKYPRHYGKFQNIAKACNVSEDWTYMDLLFLRETDQTKVVELCNDSTGLDFIRQQLQISIKILEDLNPDLIVVCNSGARQFFGVDKKETSGIWMGYDFIFDEKFGVDIITGIHSESIKSGVKSTKLIGTPVLFSSTLTYMDSSTKERLIWQIKQILKFKDIYFGQENFSTNFSERIFNQVNAITERIKDIRKEKAILIADNKYEHSANLRTQELVDIDKILELLLTELK